MKKNNSTTPKPNHCQAKKQIKSSTTADELFDIGNICNDHKVWGKIIHRAEEMGLPVEVVDAMETKRKNAKPVRFS
jgi:hypothetical protein